MGVVLVPKDEVLHVPASGLGCRAGILHGEKVGKDGNEALALAITPVAPDRYLPRVHGVVGELCRPRVDHGAERNASLLQQLPELGHFRLFFSNPRFQAEWRISDFIGLGLRHLAIGPRRAWQIEK